jgi:hypothetical protein
MEKTTVYLTTAQKEALARAARAEGRSEARLIRAGVDVVTARHRAAEAPAAVPSPVGGAEPAANPTIASPGRDRWIDREAFLHLLASHRADPGLRAELRALAPDLTAELPGR